MIDNDIIFFCNITPLLSHPLHLPPYLFRGGNEKVTILSTGKAKETKMTKSFRIQFFFSEYQLTILLMMNHDIIKFPSFISLDISIPALLPRLQCCDEKIQQQQSAEEAADLTVYYCVREREGPTQQLHGHNSDTSDLE